MNGHRAAVPTLGPKSGTGGRETRPWTLDRTMSFNCPYYKQKKVGNVGETLSRGHRENTIPESNVQ